MQGFFSIVLMAVADGDYRFTYVDIGAYGTEGDANVFQNCSLGKAIKENILHFPITEENSTPYLFVADDAFPLHPRILKPYKPTKTNPLDDDKKVFNYRLSRARRCVENAFGIMCAKNYCLSQTLFCGPDRAKRIVKTCVYLHNFLLRTRRDKYAPSYLVDRESTSGRIIRGNFRDVVPSESLFHNNLNTTPKGRCNNSGIIVQNKLKEYFNSPAGAVSWQQNAAFL